MSGHPGPFPALALAPELLLLGGAVVLLHRRLRRAAATSRKARQARLALAVGAALTLAALLGLAEAARTSLTYHQLRLLLLSEGAGLAFATVLLAAGVAPRRGAVALFLGGPLGPLLWLANLGFWLLSPPFEGALHHPLLEVLQNTLFLVLGTNLYLALLRTARRDGELAHLGEALLCRLGGAAAANVLLWSSHVYYPFFIRPDIVRNTSPLVDQNIAGAVLLFVQVALLLASLGWAYRRIRRRHNQANLKPFPPPRLTSQEAVGARRT